MALLLGKIANLYNFLFYEISDPRTEEWFLMKSPIPGIAILILYRYLVRNVGPKFMKDRKPFSLKHTIIVYNIFQMLACFYILYQGLTLAWINNYKWFCEPVDTSNSQHAIDIAYKFCYSYFVIKLIDLLDTVFFVMRKKYNQVSFLHLYHHSGMVMFSWSMVKWLPGGHGTSLVLINSAVHIVMYFYYLLTAYDESFKQSIWWKKYVTQIQIIQFGLILIHHSSVFFIEDCQYPVFPSMVLIPQNFFMIFLFSDFYRRTYIVKKPKKE